MKKFMIFLLMAFLCLGTCQARSEASHLNNAYPSLLSWVSPTSHSLFMDSKAMNDVVVMVTPSQPQSIALSGSSASITYGVSVSGLASSESVDSYQWLVDGNPYGGANANTFVAQGLPVGTHQIACRIVTTNGNVYTSPAVSLTVAEDIIANIVGPDHACQNDVVTLTAVVENDQIGHTYQWRRNGQYIVGATNPSYSFSVADLPGLTDTLAYEFDVQIVRNGCESFYSPVHYFTVSPTPVIFIDAPLFCAGTTGTITANSYTAGGEQPYQWIWHFNGNTDTTYVNTYNVTASGVYSVEAVYQDFACNSASRNTNVKTYQDSLNIDLSPLALNADNNQGCLNTQFNLSIVDINVPNTFLGTPVYTWYMDGQLLEGVNGVTYATTLQYVGAHQFRVVATYPGFPCETAEATTTINVTPAPMMVNITGVNVICSDDYTVLFANHDGGSGYTYLWSNGETSDHIDATSGVYTVTVSNGNCSVVSDPFTVWEFGSDLQVSYSEAAVCEGQPVVLNANADGWNGEISYLWDNGSTASTITVYPTTSTTYHVTASVAFTNLGYSCSRTEEINVTVYPMPNAPTIANVVDNTICEGNQYTVSVEAPSTDALYHWYENGIEIEGENLPTITVTNPAGTYSYAVAVTTVNGCISAVSDPVSINVLSNPSVAIQGDALICEGTNIELTANINDLHNTANYTYEWRVNNATITGQTTANLQTTGNAQDEPYIFTVLATNANGCVAESDPYYVYVGSHPTVAVTSNYYEVCQGGEVTATAHLGDYNMEGITYQWYVNDTPISYGTSREFTVNIDQDPTVLRVDILQDGTLCTATGDTTVHVIIPVVLNSVVAINNGDIAKNVCEGAEIFVTAFVEDPITHELYIDTLHDYVWEENGFLMPLVTGPQFSKQLTIIDEDSTHYIYNAYINYGMPGCTAVPVSSDTITVKRNPIVEIEGVHHICYQGVNSPNVHLTAWVNGVVDVDAEYHWYKNGMLTHNYLAHGNLYNEMLEPSYMDPYYFTVEVINGDGCSTISAPFEVNIHDVPHVNITANTTDICLGGSVELRANLNDYNDTMLTFQWYENELNAAHLLPGRTHEIQTFYPTAPTDYIVEVIHLLNDNTNEHSICAAYDTMHVNIAPDLQISEVIITRGDLNMCEGGELGLQAIITGGVQDSPVVYTWYKNDQIIEGANTEYLLDSPVTVDGDFTYYSYGVIASQAASGCSTAEMVYVDTVTIAPNPSLAIETDPIVCTEEGNNITMTVHNTPEPATAYTYTWFEDNVVLEANNNGTISLHRDYRDYPYNFSVELVNEFGCTSTAATQIYVNDAPVVNITVNETQVCNGGEITLTANLNDWNADQLVFNWYDNGTLIPGATSLTYTVAPTQGEHVYTFTVDQLTSLCHATSNEVTVNVVADPVIESIDTDLPASNVLCEGRQVTMTANVQGGVQGGEIFTWYRNGQVIEGATAATYTETPQAINDDPTTYEYTVSVAQTAAGCESSVSSQTVRFVVNPNPTLAIETDPIVCNVEGNNITMIAHVYPEPTTEYTYTWFEDNAVIASNADATFSTHRDYRDYPYNFSVELVNEYGCSTTAATLVYVNDAPVININATETVICEGGEITLTANLNDWNADQLVYQWYDNGTLIPGATSLTYTVVPALGTHEYTFTVDQLTSQCSGTSNTVAVIVNPIPVISEVVVNDYNVCEGAQLTITAVPSDEPQVGEVYTWYRNGVLMAGATAQTIQDSPVTVDNNTQQFVYTAVLTRTAAGCQSLPVASSVVTIYPNPTVVISGDQHVCETDSVFLIANVDTIGAHVGSLHYTWYEAGQIRDNMAYGLGDNQFFAEYLYARTEPYRFVVEVQRDGVEHGCAARSQEYNVYVYAQPRVNITATETEICTNGEVTLTANLDDYNATNIVYQWYEIRTRQEINAIGWNHGAYVYDTVEVAYNYYIPGATSATYTTSLNETTTLGVLVEQTPSTCYDTDEITITVHPIPVITGITVNGETEITVCDGAQVTVAATIDAYNAEGAVYTWYRNGELIEGATQSSFSENVFTTDNHVTVNNYTAIVTLPASGCESILSVMAGTVTINPAPTTVTISGNNIICENDQTTLTAYSDVEGTFIWSNGATNVDNITVPAGVYTVTMRTAEGCEMTSAPFTVEALGTDLFVTASETSICRGEHTTLYANQNGWAGNVTYQWDAQAGNSTATTVDVQPDSTTTYHVVATVNSTNGSCSAEGTVTIIVNQLPEQVNVTLDQNTICEGMQATMHADGGAVAYIWYQNGVVIPGENQATLTVNFPAYGDYTFAAKAISDQGCVSAIASEPVTVHVTPAPSTVSISGINVLCEGSQTTLTAYSDVEGTFSWSNGATGVDNITVPAGVYTVTMRTAEGCEMTSAPFTVEALGTDLFVTASETAICQGEHTTLYANQDGWAGNVTYQWDAQAGNSTATTVDVQPEATTTYHVIATVSSTNGTCTAEGTVTIVVTPRPEVVEVTASAAHICEGEQVTFNASGNAYSYIWYNNGIEIEGENQAVITLNFNEEGTYAISAKAVNDQNCESAEASLPAVVVVNAAPESVVISGELVICDGGSTTLYANVTPSITPNDVVTYTWFYNNNVIANATAESLVVTESGSYKVEVSTNGCSTISDAVVVMIQETPRLQLTATETTICQDGMTVITAEATGWANSNVTYTWNNGFAGTSYTFFPTAAGDYTFAVTASQAVSGCVASDSLTIHVNATPAAPEITLNYDQICDGGQVVLTVNNDYTTYGNATYQWYRNGQLINGATQAVYSESPIAIDNDLTTYSYNAVVTFDASGCSSATSINHVVTVLPTPQVQIAFEGNNTICEGGNVTMTANVTPAATYTYQWYRDNVMMVGETNATMTDSPVARETAYTYAVEVTAAPGCIVREGAPYSVNVVADPVLTVSVDDAILCQGGTTTFRVNVEDGVGNTNGLGRYTYAWYNNLNTVTPIGTGATYTTTGNEVAGAYEYWVVVSSIYGCETTSEVINHTVVADPVVTIAVAPGADVTVCDGGVTTLIANVQGGYGTPSYQWYKNGLPMYGETNMTVVTDPIVYGNAANNTYTVVVSQAGVDCQGTSLAYTVNVVPHYEVNITGNDNVCVGGYVTMTANVANMIAGDPVSYQWFMLHDGNETAINGANAAQYTTSSTLLAGSYEYYVVVTSNISGCTYAAATSVDANVVADPTVRIEAANQQVVVCEDGDINLTAIVSNGVPGAAYTYTWTWTGPTSGSVTTATPNYPVNLPANDPANPYVFRVTIDRNDATGCAATSDAISLNFVAAPVVTITANRPYICQGGEVTFTANVATGAAYDYDYAWTINGVAQSTNANTITTTLQNAGAIAASVTVSRPGTTACATTVSLAVPVQVVADPVVTIAADHLTMCAGGTTTLSVQNIVVDNNIPANYSYQWALNGFEVEGAINSTFVQPLNAAGTYVYTLMVTQTDNLGCASAWSAPVTVQVAEQPSVALNSDYGLNICEGGQISLTGTVTNFGNTVNGVLNSSIYGPMTFNWLSQGTTAQINNNITIAQNQITETLNTVGNYDYQVVVTPAGYACQPAASNIVTVGVVSDPSWTDVHVYYPDVCIGQDVILEAGIQGGVVDAAGSTNGHIQWTVTYNGTTSNVSGGFGGNSYDRPSVAGSYVYTPTWVGNIGNGCAFTNTAAVQTNVEVHALPTAAFTAGDGTVICANVSDASAELTITFTGTAPFTFQLQDLETGIVLPAQVSGTNTYTLNVTPDHTTQYRIIMVSDAYCENGELNNTDAIATIFVNDIRFDETMFISGCNDNGMVTINFNMVSGEPASDFVVTYANGEVYTGTINNNTATFQAPAAPGDYPAVFSVDGCNYDIVVRVLVGEFSFGGQYPIMDQRWNDVVVVNNNPETNGGHTFVGFQWYKNGVLIPGATYSNYQEIGGLNGFYSVELIEQGADGTMVTYMTCESYFSTASQIKVYPVPANVHQEITIELDLTDEELQGATLDIFDVTGQLVQHMTNILPVTKVSGFNAQGTYFGRILTGTNEIKTVKFIIVK